jgi:aminoglycoside phosphotransferase (APT) family kinase protein
MTIASGARDDETLRAGIERWVRAQRSYGDGAIVAPISRPAAGLSSDTCFVDVTNAAGDTTRLVVRLAPPGDGLFPSYDLEAQVRRQEALRGVGIPTAPARYEADPSWLGTPFMVMPRVEGAVLRSNPSFLRAGWLVDGGPARQRAVITSFLGTLGRLNRLAPSSIDAPVTPLVDTVQRWSDYLDWAAAGAPAPDHLDAARRWCVEHLPDDAEPSVLWGDVQLTNCVFADDGAVAALLDFELTGTGPAETDVGWFLALHDMTVATSGPDLPGLGHRDDMLAVYEAALGRAVAPLRWYEVFALVRSGSIMVRIARLLARRGVDDSWLTRGNPTTAAIRRLLD